MSELAEARKFNGRRRPRAHAAPAEKAWHDASVAGPAHRRRSGPEPRLHAPVRGDGRDQERAARLVREIRPDRLPRQPTAAPNAGSTTSARPTAPPAVSLHQPIQHDGLARRRRACGTSTEAAGLPLGIQVVAQPWRDDVVLAAMAHIEQQTGGWQMPPI